jgi:dynein intermediate chain 2
MEIVYVYQRQRREFGRHPTFSDRLAEISTDVAPEPQYLRNYEERRRGQVDIQAIPDKSEHEVTLFL